MDKGVRKPLGKKTYVDGFGYMRFNDSDILVSRWVARKEIWGKDRRKYPLKFGSYVVHHKNGDKLDNSVENLEVVRRKVHRGRHWIVGGKNRFKVALIVVGILAVGIWLLVFAVGYFWGEDDEAVVCDYDFYDCEDFWSREEAQSVFDDCGEDVDVHGLDGDGDGVVCEGMG